MAVSTKPSDPGMMSLVVPPDIVLLVLELFALIWNNGPLYDFERDRTMLYAATHGMLASA